MKRVMDNMLLTLLVSVVIIAITGALLRFGFTITENALDRWGRYEMRWEHDNPLPYPMKFFTLWGAQSHLNEMKTETQEVFFIYDLKTGEKL